MRILRIAIKRPIYARCFNVFCYHCVNNCWCISCRHLMHLHYLYYVNSCIYGMSAIIDIVNTCRHLLNFYWWQKTISLLPISGSLCAFLQFYWRNEFANRTMHVEAVIITAQNIPYIYIYNINHMCTSPESYAKLMRCLNPRPCLLQSLDDVITLGTSYNMYRVR